MSEGRSKIYLVILVVIAGGVGWYLFAYSNMIVAEIQEYDTATLRHVRLARTEKPKAITAKGLYLTANSAASASKRAEIIELIRRTELNAVVIDIKDYSGFILYDSKLPLVRELETGKPTIKNIRTVIDEFRKAGIYVIARQTVFQDPALAKARPQWAINASNGGLWRDYKGLSWVDPTLLEVWQYNMAIAKEAIDLGFDEINFDYVRFPSDGNIRTAVYANLQGDKAETMHAFYNYVAEQLGSLPAYTSYDLFGLVLEAQDFDLNIGQKLSTALDTVDYIYPMTYPSHYPDGHLKFSNPADHPYEVVRNGLEKAEPLMNTAKKSKLRPWVQAFNLGATYDGAKIRAQIKAIEESPVTAGWMLWNAANRYTTAGLELTEVLPES